MNFTLIVQRGENGWLVGQLAEMPAVITQGRNMEELRFMIRDGLELILEVERESTLKRYEGEELTTELFDYP